MLINLILVIMKLVVFFLVLGILTKYLTRKIAATHRFQAFGDLVNRVNTNEKVVALTYDDGPNPPYTNQLLEVLDDLKVKATFFLIGRNIEEHPQMSRAILEGGHELGNHSYSHEELLFRPKSFVNSEIEKTDQLLRELGVVGNIHFRAPFGYKGFVLPWLLSKLNKKHILWNVDPRDYLAKTPEEVVEMAQSQMRPGSIILLHDGGGERQLTVHATKSLIQTLRAEGYRFATVSELIQLKA